MHKLSWNGQGSAYSLAPITSSKIVFTVWAYIFCCGIIDVGASNPNVTTMERKNQAATSSKSDLFPTAVTLCTWQVHEYSSRQKKFPYHTKAR